MAFLTCRAVDIPEVKQKYHLVGEEKIHLEENQSKGEIGAGLMLGNVETVALLPA